MDFKQRFSGKISIVSKKGLKSNLLQPDYQLPKSYTLKQFRNAGIKNPQSLANNQLSKRNTARSYNMTERNQKHRYSVNTKMGLNRKYSQRISPTKQYAKQYNSLQKTSPLRLLSNLNENKCISNKQEAKQQQKQKNVPYFYIDSMFQKHSNFIMMLDRKLSYRM